MKALLNIAGTVQVSGKEVNIADIVAAKSKGAGDRFLHDTVLVAAAFCMLNRYVDGLAILTPTDAFFYEKMGKRMASGYKLPLTGST